VPLARILCIAAILVHGLALGVRLVHVGASTADGIGHLSSHHGLVIAIGVAILGIPQNTFQRTNQGEKNTR